MARYTVSADETPSATQLGVDRLLFVAASVFGEYEEMQGAFRATYKQLPKQFENPSVCVNGIKSTCFTGEILNDVEFGENRGIKGGKLTASRPIDVISVFPPIL